ncbi:MAG: NAD-dependent malic enzyme [Nitrospirae bacterium]|jgi:malate dehydrogenase (oxaloacetate-decarboxylating)|nr:NAD-dependent malic enzyme [Nitrospirota bacterium]
MQLIPGPGYTITIRLEMPKQVGLFSSVASVINKVGGDICASDIVKTSSSSVFRDFTVNARDDEHEKEIIEAVKKIEGVRIVHVSDRTFLSHQGGKIEIHNKLPIKDRNDLSRVYTPGVARICMAIYNDRQKAYRYTIKRNSIAIITDGTAVLGLGDIGPEAALPVMEGKAMIFKEFANIDAFPLCLSTSKPDEIVNTIINISPSFGGINLEDISAPRCFVIEEKLKKELDIPVFHDDQHGTAVVVLAALLNSLKVVHKKMEDLKVVISGAGAAGIACCKILIETGVKNIIVCDTSGSIYEGRTNNMNPAKKWVSENTNQDKFKGSLPDALSGADVFIGVSTGNILTVEDIKKMAGDSIVFALANPVPEISPDEALPFVRIMATGRSDYPNQINNMLCFPGLFRGLLDSRARMVNEEIKLAAAKAIASVIDEKDLSEDYIIPSIFNKRVVQAVASAVEEEAYRTGVAGKER